MKTLLKILSLVVVIQSTSMAEDERRVVDFRNDLIPLLTKHGCNAGACHGAAIGRGGFKLSLYGGNPTADYAAIVHQVSGRRINLVKPDDSLIVLKPSEYVEHGGQMVIDYDGESAQLLIDWIRQGAEFQSVRQLHRVEIQPRRHIAKSLDQPVPFQVTAHYDDGSQRDVTKWTIFTAEDSSAVEVDAETATATTLRRGRHIVVARYLTEVVPIEMVVPINDASPDFAEHRPNNFIDEEILQSLAMLGLEPSPGCDDAAFLRRTTLNLIGRLPSKQAVNDFLSDEDPNKRSLLVDRLLDSDEFAQYWTLQLAKLLRIRPRGQDVKAATTYHKWLADQVRQGDSYRELARELILASGNIREIGPANFVHTTTGPREQAEFMSELFMGSRIRCANCHNHPLDRWTQDDYHGLAAIFARIKRGTVVGENPRGKVIHPVTLEPATQRLPGERFLDSSADGREQLADWLTDPANPYFAKAIVNRLWKQMMGRGLVEPVDDFRDTNPATHPELLDKLAEDFISSGYNLRHTLRVIAASDAYARSAYATKQNKDDDRFYSHAIRRPLEAEVLADAISDVLGIADRYGDTIEGTRAIALVDPTSPSRTLDVLGRCGRENSCEDSAPAVGGLSQKLHMFNGPLLNARLGPEGSRLRQLLDAGTEPAQIIEEFYLVALGRHPSAPELDQWIGRMERADDTQAFFEDWVWGLLTSRDFVTNH